FKLHDSWNPPSYQFATPYTQYCSGVWGYGRKHLRVRIGDTDDAIYKTYYLGAAHEDIAGLDCIHNGTNFNGVRLDIANAFADDGHLVEYLDVGNTDSIGGQSSDGKVAVIWINPPPITSCSDQAAFLGQSTYPTVSPRQNFSIYFEVRNNSACTWTDAAGYHLENVQNPLGAPTSWAVADTYPPAAIKRFTIGMTAPTSPGVYRTQWTLKHGSQSFGPNMFIDVTVSATAPPMILTAMAFPFPSMRVTTVPKTLTGLKTRMAAPSPAHSGPSGSATTIRPALTCIRS